MAVAETPTSAPVTQQPQQSLAVSALLGALYIFFSFGLVFSGLPTIWREIGMYTFMHEFLGQALLLVVTVPLAVALVLFGWRLLGDHPQRGVRSGAAIGALLIFGTLLVSLLVLNLLAPQGMEVAVQVGVALVVAAVLLYCIYWLFTRPAFGVLLGRLEDNGWFELTSFKGNQGIRVRRGTVVGILVLVICGLWVLITHGTLRGGNWEIPLPFLGAGRTLPILFNLNITVPLLILAVAIWFAWRIVNWPPFADFLIATEAEMNKVSWTTRKRLVQDTIVVLVTVFLFTVFLFVVDILWVWILSSQPVRVLLVDPGAERAKQNAPTSW